MARGKSAPPISGSVEIKRGDEVHTGWYDVESGMITVTYRLAEKTTQLGGSPPETLARLLLSEMI